MISVSELVKVDSAGMPGEYIRCTRCSEVGDAGLMATHVCAPIKVELTDEQMKVQTDDLMLARLMKRVQEWPDQQLLDAVPDLSTAIHRWEKYVKYAWDNKLQAVEGRFTPEILYRIAVEQRDFLLKRTREMRDEEIALNDERRAKGISYAERSKLLNRSKLEWCDQEETKLLRSFRIKPLREWFDEVDYWSAKEFGMKWVIRHKLELIMD